MTRPYFSKTHCIASLTISVLVVALFYEVCAQPPAEPNLPAFLTAKPRSPALGADELQTLLIARYNAAQAETQACMSLFTAGRAEMDGVLDAGRRLLASELELSEKKADRIAVHEKFLELAKFAELIVEKRSEFGIASTHHLERARYMRIDAEIGLLRAKR